MIGKMLEDTDAMPFGKYGPKPKGEGRNMADVPANYFHYLWVNGKREDKQCPVADYILRNLSALRTEHPDGVWNE